MKKLFLFLFLTITISSLSSQDWRSQYNRQQQQAQEMAAKKDMISIGKVDIIKKSNIKWVVIGVVGLILFSMSFRTVEEGHEGLVLTLGKHSSTRAPGMTLIIPFIQQLWERSIQETSVGLREQKSRTKDNIPILIDGIVNYKVIDSKKAYLLTDDVENILFETAQGILSDEANKTNLDNLQQNRETASNSVLNQLRVNSDRWGIEVLDVLLQNIGISKELEAAMAQKAESIQRGMGSVEKAGYEQKAASIRKETAKIYAEDLNIMRLREIEMIEKVAGDKNTVIMVPTEGLNSVPVSINAYG